VVSATALLQRNPDPTETQIREGLSGNICRCTGYQGILRAVRSAAESMKG
jgi:carbon-monoxide dehydrogenase small subunit